MKFHFSIHHVKSLPDLIPFQHTFDKCFQNYKELTYKKWYYSVIFTNCTLKIIDYFILKIRNSKFDKNIDFDKY